MLHLMQAGIPTFRRNISSKDSILYLTYFLRRYVKSLANLSEILKTNDKKFIPGTNHYNFTCTRAEYISDFNLTSYTFRHNKVGSELWYIDRADQNNVFLINFRTTPLDSTGLPHILEHNVLCGSEKFPIRDPFFKMLTRSVATFMNAMTGPDYTIYPFSSMNETDFRNLQKIYLDAVFRPNLKYLDFLQEGWRLENEELNDINSKLTIKGVVYNEMKGAFSENSLIFAEQLLNSLLPDHTYGFVSGGNPIEIPKLKHQDLIDFHKKYYHPSNSRFFVYGNFDINKTLEYIDTEYLSTFEKIENNYSAIPNQQKWDEPRNVHINGRYESMGAPFERQNQIAISLLMDNIENFYETFVLHVIADLLIKGPNAYFYKSLIEPNFSGGYNQITGYDTNVKNTFFSVGLQDIKVKDFPRMQESFDKTIQDVIKNGFQDDHIESVLHNIELHLKHQTPHFGLRLLFNALSLWNHDGDVVSSLKVNSLIQKLRQEIKRNPIYLQEKVDFYFRNNKHRLTLTMSPDENYENKFKEAELKLLNEKITNMTQIEKERIFKEGLDLQNFQKLEHDINVLPILKLSDVENPPEPYKMELSHITKVPTSLYEVHTNGIVYLKCLFNIHNLNPDEINLLPLFCTVINEMGTKNYDYCELDKIITSKTSGIDFRLHFAENINNATKYDLGVLLTSHCLEYNVPKMFELCKEILCNFKMNDTSRFNMLSQNYLSSLSVGIINSGHHYAMQSCSGLVTEAAKLKSHLTGIDHIDYMKNLLTKSNSEQLLADLKVLGQKLFDAASMRIAINASTEQLLTITNNINEFVENFPLTKHSKKINDAKLLNPSSRHIILDIPVNFCSKAFLTVPYTHPDHPTLKVLAKLLSAKYLLPVVREQNGAYGAGAKIGIDGIFTYYSYRDPNSRTTLDVFDKTYDWIMKNYNEITDQVLFESKLGILQQLDAPEEPGNKGTNHFLFGLSQDLFNKYRLDVMQVSRKQLFTVIEKYFEKQPKHYGKCVLGPKNDKLKRKSENWIISGH